MLDDTKIINLRQSNNTWITPSDVIEYCFCPRFIYFMYCLLIPQNEQQRTKVVIGREIHSIKSKINRNYLRKKIGAVAKDIDVYLGSEKYGIRGIVDEVLILSDNTLAPLDYKFAKYQDTVYKTLRYQSLLYSLLIMDNYNVAVNKGYICYIRSKNYLKEIVFKPDDYNKVFKIIEDIFKIIELNKFPKPTQVRRRCIDCCYRNICAK